jgi:predicted DNA-binding protein (UPF0251 family)
MTSEKELLDWAARVGAEGEPISALAGRFPDLPPTPPPIGRSYEIRYKKASYLETGHPTRHEVGTRRTPVERDEEALKLKETGHLSYAEIADRLHVAKASVDHMLSRARRVRAKLASRPEPCLPDEHAPPDEPRAD